VIDRLQGVLLRIDPEAVVIDLHGFGLRVEVTPSTADSLGPPGQAVTLLTQLLFVGAQDPQPRLFGFKSPEARILFGLLRGVSGIGPSTALRLLAAQATPAEVAGAIARGDAKALKVKGVGAKIAQRVIVELQDKMTRVLAAVPRGGQAGSPVGAGSDRALEDAFLALRGLEFDPQRARALLEMIRSEHPQSGADELVRAVLIRA